MDFNALGCWISTQAAIDLIDSGESYVDPPCICPRHPRYRSGHHGNRWAIHTKCPEHGVVSILVKLQQMSVQRRRGEG